MGAQGSDSRENQRHWQEVEADGCCFVGMSMAPLLRGRPRVLGLGSLGGHSPISRRWWDGLATSCRNIGTPSLRLRPKFAIECPANSSLRNHRTPVTSTSLDAFKVCPEVATTSRPFVTVAVLSAAASMMRQP